MTPGGEKKAASEDVMVKHFSQLLYPIITLENEDTPHCLLTTNSPYQRH